MIRNDNSNEYRSIEETTRRNKGRVGKAMTLYVVACSVVALSSDRAARQKRNENERKNSEINREETERSRYLCRSRHGR